MDGTASKKSRGLIVATLILALSWNTIDHVKNLAWDAFLDYFGDDGLTLWTYGECLLEKLPGPMKKSNSLVLFKRRKKKCCQVFQFFSSSVESCLFVKL